MIQPHPKVAAILRDHADLILDRWAAEVRSTLPSADELTMKQLRDDLPELMKYITHRLAKADLVSQESLDKASPKHGVARFDQNYKLEELLVEYQVLRKILLEHLASAFERSLDIEEVMAINDAIDTAVQLSSLAFAKKLSNQLASGAEDHAKYLSFLSHDLRGGLNGVLLMIEVLHRDLKGHREFSQSLEDLDMMKQSILDTVSTMDRFLHAEKLRKGMFKLNPAPLDLGEFTRQLVAQHQSLARAKSVEIRVQVPAGVEVVTDRELLKLATQNMLGNAIKFTDEGAISVSAAILPDGYCRCSIEDNGPGLTETQRANIFQQFSTGPRTSKQGTGLGLFIANQASLLLRARLGILPAEAGKGATFYIDLPSSVSADAPLHEPR